jgi:thymidylate synthase (FAD)
MNINVLDYGYVKAIEGWGRDESIIEAARMSTGKGFQGWESDQKLLAFLYNNKHATPFEMAGLVIEVKAPIFVFREWHRHRTQSYNEMSARYIPLPDQNYVPTAAIILERIAAAGANKQARGATDRVPTEQEVEKWLDELQDAYEVAESTYQRGLSLGIPKEIARSTVPVGRYSRMRASANLRNWLAFLTLRMAPNAQWEIRQYAYAVDQIIADRFPRTWELFNAERTNGGK